MYSQIYEEANALAVVACENACELMTAELAAIDMIFWLKHPTSVGVPTITSAICSFPLILPSVKHAPPEKIDLFANFTRTSRVIGKTVP